jgi:hypothetical protein
MSKINKNLRKIDRYTLSLLVLTLSMFSCTNSDNTNINNKNDSLLGKGDKDKKDKKEDKNTELNAINNNIENNTINNNIESNNNHDEDKINGTCMTIFVNQNQKQDFIKQLRENINQLDKNIGIQTDENNNIIIYI